MNGVEGWIAAPDLSDYDGGKLRTLGNYDNGGMGDTLIEFINRHVEY